MFKAFIQLCATLIGATGLLGLLVYAFFVYNYLDVFLKPENIDKTAIIAVTFLIALAACYNLLRIGKG